MVPRASPDAPRLLVSHQHIPHIVQRQHRHRALHRQQPLLAAAPRRQAEARAEEERLKDRQAGVHHVVLRAGGWAGVEGTGGPSVWKEPAARTRTHAGPWHAPLRITPQHDKHGACCILRPTSQRA